MRMITRCPACGTAFRIYQEQLDARQGQVRCGHCQVVFNANRHLVVEPDAPAKPASAPKPEAAAQPKAQAQPETRVETKAAAAPEKPEDKVPAAPPAEPEPADDEIPATVPTEAKPARENEPVTLDMADATQFDFGPRAPSRRNGGPWWTAATVLLIALLFLQGLYLFRTEVARALPAARPHLERACAKIGCDVPYPRESELVTLEASDLQAVPGTKDVLRLSAVLRNRATFPQAFPAIELTLTDDANTTVARRVLQPRDYLPAERAGGVFGANTELSLDLHLDAAGLGASGYRLYVFYP